jgi:cytochrome c556
MQAGSLWQVSAALTAGAQVLGLQPSMQQQAAQQAMKMLGHELGGLQRDCFRCHCPVHWL